MAAHLHLVRSQHTHAPHVTLSGLLRIDSRLAAHLEGLAVAGETGVAVCGQALVSPDRSEMFAAALGVIERADDAGVARMYALAEAAPELRSGLISAFGWVEPRTLQRIVADALSSDKVVPRSTGVAACALHRVDPGLLSARRIGDASPLVRARAMRTAGEIGCRDALPSCEAALRDDDADVRFWSGWAMVLLGHRGVALEALTSAARGPCPDRTRAFRLAFQAMTPNAAHRLLQDLASAPEHLPWLLRGSAVSGDPAYVPWLISQMANERAARLAGEAFSLITGLDLAFQDLERKPPEDFETGPNDDPGDADVAVDDDDGLPWPDAEKIQGWWRSNGAGFQQGQRYFMGAPVTWEHCLDVLRNGYQRQRILAAHYLCLLRPGTPLFNTSAPAWRQQRLLAQMH
jgi:uncharacterized protein (TIGR02270 family)